MSHRATTWAFQQRGLKPAAKIVLFFLADRHNPDYGCFPSQETLAVDCEMSERSVRNQLDTLETIGLIKRVKRKSNGGIYQSDRYMLGFEITETQEPAANFADGKNASEPAANSGNIQRQNLPPNPVREPLREPVRVKSLFGLEEIFLNVVSQQAAKSFIKYRKMMKKPLSETAAKAVVTSLNEIKNRGGDPDAALGMIEERGWLTIRPDWFFNIRKSTPGTNDTNEALLRAAKRRNKS